MPIIADTASGAGRLGQAAPVMFTDEVIAKALAPGLAGPFELLGRTARRSDCQDKHKQPDKPHRAKVRYRP